MTRIARSLGVDSANALPGRPVSASRTEMIEMVLPQYANLLGNILGGRVNENGNPCPVPPVILRTQAERRRYREAGERRKARLAIRAKRRRPGDR